MVEKKTNDPYLEARIAIAKNEDHAYLLEVDGVCPLCGKNLLASKGNSKSKLYQIAHIYPNSPIPNQVDELSGLERLGSNCEDYKNKIALCKDCHGLYDDKVTKREYLALVDIKKQLLNIANTKASLSSQNLEDDISMVINSLSTIKSEELKKINLKYKGLEVKKKIEDDYAILRNKIVSYNCIYYYYIKELFQNMEQIDFIFDIIACEVKLSFLKSQKEMNDKSAIFNSLVFWMNSKVKNSKIESCEVIIAFFVQNCEVFDEIA